MGEGEVHRGLMRKAEERHHMDDLDIDGWIILKWIFKKFNRAAWTGVIWLRISGGAEFKPLSPEIGGHKFLRDFLS